MTIKSTILGKTYTLVKNIATFLSYNGTVSSNQPSCLYSSFICFPNVLMLLERILDLHGRKKKEKKKRESFFSDLTDARIAIDSFEDLITRVWHQSTRTNAAKHRSKAKLRPGTLTRSPEKKDKRGLVQFNFKKRQSRILFLYFSILYTNVQLVHWILLMAGFELQISGVGSNRFTNWATTTTHSIGQFSFFQPRLVRCRDRVPDSAKP